MSTYLQNKTFRNILIFYWKKHEITPGSTTTSLKFDSKPVSIKTLAKYLVRDRDALDGHCGMMEYVKLLEVVKKEYELKDQSDYIEQLASLVFTYLRNKVHKEQSKKILGDYDRATIKDFSYKGMIPIIDIYTTDKVLYNTLTKNVVHFAGFDSYDEWLKKQTQAVKEQMNSSFTPAKIEYNPTVSGGERAVKVEEQEVTCVNSHILPDWRKKELKDPKLPKLFKDLMKHLFPEKQCQEYILTWIYHMLDSRNTVHLLLHGHRGIGKNTLVSLLGELVGLSNYYVVPKKFFNVDFNSELRNRRLLFFDEHKIDSRKNLSEFKQYSETSMTYHKKGVSIAGNERNFSSHIIANNLEEINHLVQEARRFSVPILTSIPIREGMGDKVEEILIAMKDQKFLANVGWWILNNAPIHKFKREEPYKTRVFFDIVNNALYPWQKALIDLLTSRANDRYYLEDHEDDLTDRRTGKVGRSRIDNFLLSHKDEEGKFFGELKLDRGTKKRYIKPNQKYAPEVKQESSNTGDDLNEW